MRERAERFARVLAAVEAELDWAELGEVYCEGPGADLFVPEQVEALREAGLLLADDLATALEGLGGDAPPRSLYVGAGVAELVPMLCESVVFDREVRLVSLPGAELDQLGRAFARVGERLGATLPVVDARPLAQQETGPASHAWMVSVLTDPDGFPALHDRLYGRTGKSATGRGDLDEERGRAEALLDELLRRLWVPGVLTTTDEELSLLGPRSAALGLVLDVPLRARLSGLVGDPVRVCRVRRGEPRRRRGS